jgi:hypothetical protein
VHDVESAPPRHDGMHRAEDPAADDHDPLSLISHDNQV